MDANEQENMASAPSMEELGVFAHGGDLAEMARIQTLAELKSSHFPGALEAVARLCGVTDAIRVAMLLGGIRVYLCAKEDNKFVRIVGVPKAKKLIAELGNSEIDVPNAKSVLNWMRARQMKRAGMSYTDISSVLNLSEKRICELTRGVKRADGAEIKPGRRSEVNLIKNKIYELHRSGKAALEISEILNTPREIVWRTIFIMGGGPAGRKL